MKVSSINRLAATFYAAVKGSALRMLRPKPAAGDTVFVAAESRFSHGGFAGMCATSCTGRPADLLIATAVVSFTWLRRATSRTYHFIDFVSKEFACASR